MSEVPLYLGTSPPSLFSPSAAEELPACFVVHGLGFRV